MQQQTVLSHNGGKVVNFPVSPSRRTMQSAESRAKEDATRGKVVLNEFSVSFLPGRFLCVHSWRLFYSRSGSFCPQAYVCVCVTFWNAIETFYQKKFKREQVIINDNEENKRIKCRTNVYKKKIAMNLAWVVASRTERFPFEWSGVRVCVCVLRL